MSHQLTAAASSSSSSSATTPAAVHHKKFTPWAEAGAVAVHRAPWTAPVSVAAEGRPPHHAADGTFRNPWTSYIDYGPRDFFFKALPELRRVDTYALPTVTPSWAEIAAPAEALQATWLGHAGVLVQAHGFNILTDPVFSARASLSQWVGPKRFTPPPCELGELPPVHVVLLSHNHYDHIDEGTVKGLLRAEAAALARPAPTTAAAPSPYAARPYLGTLWVVPLRVGALLESLGVRRENIQELDWWDSFSPGVSPAGLLPAAASGTLARKEWVSAPAPPAAAAAAAAAAPASASSGGAHLTIVAVPAQHQSARTLWDRNRSLWAGYVVLAAGEHGGATTPSAPAPSPSSEVRFYFSGDTGYRSVPKGASEEACPVCPVFAEIGAALGPFDLSFLPIGAYSPRAFMSSFHASPEDSVGMHVDVKSHRSVGMHWAAFPLTDEPVEEPPVRLRAAAAARGLRSDEFIAVWPGALIRAGAGVLNPEQSAVGEPSASYTAAIAKPAGKGLLGQWF